jgi:hypothetical protein
VAAFLTASLPWIALALWCAIYGLYFGLDPAFRRRLERSFYHNTHRRRPMPVMVPRAAPHPAVDPRPPVTALITGPATTVPARPLVAWQVDSLPMRYRLLGQVRAASNDN